MDAGLLRGLLGLAALDSDSDSDSDVANGTGTNEKPSGDNKDKGEKGEKKEKQTHHHQTREAKTAQSEAEFQAVRAAYRPKVENGEIWKTLRLNLNMDIDLPPPFPFPSSSSPSSPPSTSPLPPSTPPSPQNQNQTQPQPQTKPLPKPQAQELLHAVEELYFFRRYGEGAALARAVLESSALEGRLDADTRETMAVYEGKCLARMGGGDGVKEGGRGGG